MQRMKNRRKSTSIHRSIDGQAVQPYAIVFCGSISLLRYSRGYTFVLKLSRNLTPSYCLSMMPTDWRCANRLVDNLVCRCAVKPCRPTNYRYAVGMLFTRTGWVEPLGLLFIDGLGCLVAWSPTLPGVRTLWLPNPGDHAIWVAIALHKCSPSTCVRNNFCPSSCPQNFHIQTCIVGFAILTFPLIMFTEKSTCI